MTMKPHHIVAIEAIHCPIPPFSIPHTLTIHNWSDEATLPTRIHPANIIITTTIRLSAHLLDPAVTPHLQLIVIMATGTDCVDKAAAAARGITVCNCPGTNVESVSEHALGLYFATRRRLVELSVATRDVPQDPDMGRDSEWKMKGSLRGRVGTPPLTCCDETVGIIGYGAVGKRIHTLARALGMNVLVAERKSSSSGISTPRPGRTSFQETLRNSTVLILCLPRSPETLNLISTPEFQSMTSPQAILINVARGGIVDDQALLDALKGGLIAGAATDAYAIEPAGRGDSPLLSPEADGLNLVLTPHLAWLAERTLRNLQESVRGVVEGWYRGEVVNVVN